MTYYNENDPKAAAWLRELMAAGHIPAGVVDERSITEIKPHELTGYAQQHFFAGIGGWAYALRLAGWSDDRPVRTGSCPCQPFSQAGQGKGEADERHLWPMFRDLILFGEPTVTFGEQVASKAGREWLAGIRADLEGLGYEVGAADLCAASTGSPHIRQRLFWVADAHGRNASAKRQQRRREHGLQPQGDGSGGRSIERGRGAWDRYDILQCTDGKARRVESGTFPLAHGIPGRVGLLRGYGNAIVPQVAAQFVAAWDSLNEWNK